MEQKGNLRLEGCSARKLRLPERDSLSLTRPNSAAMEPAVKKELQAGGVLSVDFERQEVADAGSSLIDLSSSSDSDDGDEDACGFAGKRSRSPESIHGQKKAKPDGLDVVLPSGFLDPLLLAVTRSSSEVTTRSGMVDPMSLELPIQAIKPAPCKQFWKAGDYEKDANVQSETSSIGMDHVRVHPKFLHSNATSHKWALGAIAELLDNALDEVCNGATYINIDMLINKKDGSKMILFEDDGGGMTPEIMRQCMSLGYSVKSKQANTIGQYGNGFKTSSMRLGADVIVFSRYPGKNEKSPTQSVGLLSYTFLRSTGKDDIMVPMVDYEKVKKTWQPLVRSSQSDWSKTLETVVEWSPYASEADLLQQFSCLKEHGTRIVIYNLWEDDQEELELDFDTDSYDIQLRGVNRDEKKIQMAKLYPNSRHFLTYQHSLRSYASILYLKLPAGFRITLREKEVEHHNLVKDMMLKEEVTYRPKDGNAVAAVTVGFVKDAKHHIDIQGFNVYHKNRLIKPFWRVWNAAGSDGRGVIGVLEANFVEPAHDKQGFERTTVLARLEARLVQIQKTYWSCNCHKVGYAPRRNKKSIKGSSSDSSPEPPSSRSRGKALSSVTGSHGQSKFSGSGKSNSKKSKGNSLLQSDSSDSDEQVNGHIKARPCTGNLKSSMPVSLNNSEDSSLKNSHGSGSFIKSEKLRTLRKARFSGDTSHHDGSASMSCHPTERMDNVNAVYDSHTSEAHGLNGGREESIGNRTLKEMNSTASFQLGDTSHKAANHRRSNEPVVASHARVTEIEEKLLQLHQELQFEKDRNKSLEAQLQEYKMKLEDASKEQESLIDIFSEERIRRDKEEETLRKKLKEAYTSLQELLERHGVKAER